MSNSNNNDFEWFKKLTNAFYAVDMYCEEAKPKGAFPSGLREIKTFASMIRHSKQETAVFEGFKNMLSNPENITRFKAGLVRQVGTKIDPGEMFVRPVKLTVITPDVVYSIIFSDMIETLRVSATEKGIAVDKRKAVGLYICNTIADSIKTFILRHGYLFMDSADRNIISGKTQITDLKEPYIRDKQEQEALRMLLGDVFQQDSFVSFVDGQFGKGSSIAAKGVIDGINESTLTDVKGGLAESLAKGKIKPVWDAAMKTMSSVTAASVPDDGLSAQMADF